MEEVLGYNDTQFTFAFDLKDDKGLRMDVTFSIQIKSNYDEELEYHQLAYHICNESDSIYFANDSDYDDFFDDVVGNYYCFDNPYDIKLQGDIDYSEQKVTLRLEAFYSGG